MTPSTESVRPAPSTWRRWLARLLLTLGVIVLFLSLALRLPAMELGRLIVGGVIAPADRVIGYFGLSGGALLLLAPLLGQWANGKRRFATLTLGVVALLGGLERWWAIAAGARVMVVHYQSSDIRVEGSLYLPDGPGPFPAAIIVHGSAPFRRGFYDEWADSLVRRGVAVLVPDKRGVGGSGGVLETRNNAAAEYLTLLATDIVAGARYLRTRSDIRGNQIGLVGISQGGWVGPLAASQDSTIAFLVLLSGPATSTGEENTWSRLRGDHESQAIMSFARANDSLTRTAPRGFDPRPTLAALRVPSLWLFGERDNSVPSAKSVAALDSLARAGRPVEWQVFPGTDHVMTRHDGPLGLIYTEPASWPVWLDWVVRQVGVTPAG